MKFSKRFTPLMMILAASSIVMAQETTGTATGVITEKGSGKPLVGALVRLTSPKLLGDRTCITDQNGKYRVPLLPNGEFTAKVTAADHVTAGAVFHISSGQVSRQDISMMPVRVQTATVEVLADAASSVDKTTTVTQTTFAVEDITKIASNNYQGIVDLSPGITGTLDPTQGGYGSDAIKIRGGVGHGAKVLMNGVTVTEEGGGYLNENPTIMDMVESMAVIQSPLNARYGNTDGGIVTMVTNKGSNTFAGSVRLKYRKNYWSDQETNRSYRDGTPNGSGITPLDDFGSKTYDITMSGPIWKDHITFAYGSTISPASSGYDPVIFPNQQGDPTQSSYLNQTFLNGAQSAYIGGLQTQRYVQSKSIFNQFTVFAQLGPNHNLEWDYSETNNKYDFSYGVIDPGWHGDDHYTNRIWNLAYHGILSDNGLLEARFGKTFRAWDHPWSPGQPPIWTNLLPQNPTSLLDGVDKAGGVPQTVNTNGFNAEAGDAMDNYTFMANYEHMLNVGSSSHTIDVGVARDKFQWNIQIYSAKDQYFVPGILGGADPTASFGSTDPRYIVFNYNASLYDLDPTRSASDPVVGSTYDQRVLPNSDQHGNYGGGWPFDGWTGLVPRWFHGWGNPNGFLKMVTTSPYINDLWSINANHSVMLGLRVDMVNIYDSGSTLAKYNQPSLRFEYKWDITGKQDRLVNVSAAQFHTREPGSLFLPCAAGRWGNSDLYLWNGSNPAGGDLANTPYAISRTDLTNQDPAWVSQHWHKIQTVIGGQSFVVDSSWKAPVATEYTLGYTRTYPNGGHWRTTLIYKDWKNLFDFFPGSTFDNSGTPDYKRILRNDPSAHRSYKSVEFEWAMPFTERLQFAGNYTFSRLMSDQRGNIDNPDRTTQQQVNWRDYYESQGLSRSQVRPDVLLAPEHAVKMYFNYDLTSGKAKSNLALYFNYTSGAPINYGNPYTVNPPTIPGIDPASFSDMTQIYYSSDGGHSINMDTWSLQLKYNIELPVWRTFRWFLSAQITNPFNSRTWGPYGLGSYGTAQDWAGPHLQTAYGWRATNNPVDLNGVGGRTSGRTFGTLETGFKF